jgi:6-phosphofructokinase 1
MKKIGILTGGGDCPGLNAVIRAVVKKSLKYHWEVIGILDGWKGLIEGNILPLTAQHISGILPKGGTILGVALKLYKLGVPVVGVPKTIDNDISGTDYTFGFDTAVSIVTDAIDRLHTTAESHHRIMVLEVMGRHAGWIATVSGIAGGADEILIPEIPFHIEDVCKNLKARHDSGKRFSIVVASEGAKPSDTDHFETLSEEKDEFGHVRLGGIGQRLAKEIEKRLGVETRFTVLGHVQRGGSPTAYDRVLATRYGVVAVELVKDGHFGKMVALRGYKIVPVDLTESVTKLRTVDMDLYNIATTFFAKPHKE